MKKNKTGRLNLKKTNNNTATSTNVEKNPTPKSQTKQEKEAAKKAHAEATIAKKAEVKAANVKKNEEAQMKNQNNGQPLSRRAKESYKHFLRRKRRAKKREAFLAKQKNSMMVEKKYSLLINYNDSMKEVVLKEMDDNKLKLDISTNTYAYVKTLTKEELDKYVKALNTQSIKDKYLEVYVKKWEKNHPKSKADAEAWDEKRKAAIRKERARIDNLKSPLTFQAVKEGTIISSTVKKTEKKPSGNTTEKKIAAHNNRKAFNKARACQWKINKNAKDKLPRRLKKLYKKTSGTKGTNTQTTSKTASKGAKTAA